MASYIKQQKWTRRRLLSRLGNTGAITLLSPFVPLMEAGAAENKALRYIQWFTANQTNRVDHYWQANDGPTQMPADSPYKSLNKYADKVAVVQNINIQAAKDSGGNPHKDSAFSSLSGSDDTQKFSVGPNVSTLDQIVANHIRESGTTLPFKSLIMGFARREPGQAFSAWKGQKSAYDMDPAKVFDRLFKSGIPSNNKQSLADKRGSVLDFVNQRLKKLNEVVSNSDRQKLQAHLTTIEELERRLKDMDANACSTDGKQVYRGGTNDNKNMPAALDSYIDIIALAFACDLTRVVHFQMSNGHDFHPYSFLNFNGKPLYGDFHGWTHGQVGTNGAGANSSKLGNSAKFVQLAMNWRSEKFVSLLDKLNAIDEGDGTALDNSGILWWCETSRGHSYDKATWMVSGSMGGKLKIGHRKNYNNKVFHNQLLTTLAQGMGINSNHIGSNKYGEGALSEFLV